MVRVKVAVITGTRAEYGIYRSVLAAISANKRLELQLIVTGMHLLKNFGLTVREIERDGWKIAAHVPMYKGLESPAGSLARGIAGLGGAFKNLKSDVVLVLGDRLEMLAAANAAMCEGRVLAHLHGGETAPGQWDEQIRHAITKFSHLHFTATTGAAARVAQMGEAVESIFSCGAPALDTAIAMRDAWRADPKRRAEKRSADVPILLLHPTSPNIKTERDRTRTLLDGLCDVLGYGASVSVIGPNNDPGHEGILQAYERYRDLTLDVEMSVSQDAFWAMLWRRPFLIGNSSSGILEAATFGTPVVNVGPRQAGRERNANVLDVAFDKNEIAVAVHRCLSDAAFKHRADKGGNLYGQGQAAVKIANVLAKLCPGVRAAPKRFIDL